MGPLFLTIYYHFVYVSLIDSQDLLEYDGLDNDDLLRKQVSRRYLDIRFNIDVYLVSGIFIGSIMI